MLSELLGGHQSPAQRQNVGAGPGARFAEDVSKLRKAVGADHATTGSDHHARGASSHGLAHAAVHPECCVRHCALGSDMLRKVKISETY